MAANNIRVHTPAFYRGLPVTVVGCVDEVLIAVAAYATPFERALGVIAVRPRRSAHRYYVTGTRARSRRSMRRPCSSPHRVAARSQGPRGYRGPDLKRR